MWPDLGESSGIGGTFFLFCRAGPDHSSTSGQGQLRTTIRESGVQGLATGALQGRAWLLTHLKGSGLATTVV